MFCFINNNKAWGHFPTYPAGKYLEASAVEGRSDELETLVGSTSQHRDACTVCHKFQNILIAR